MARADKLGDQREGFRRNNAERARRKVAALELLQSQGFADGEQVVVTAYSGAEHTGTLKISLTKSKRIVGIVLYFEKNGILPIGLQNIKNIERVK